MILNRLQLQHFRNYRRLDLRLQPGLTLLHGPNGAGKTNIVEAISTLATTKSFRTRSDREIIQRNIDVADTPFPFARLQGDAEDDYRPVRVEMLVATSEEYKEGEVGAVRKRFRLDGVPRRASDVVGQIKAVLFSPADVDIVTGSPSLRRRYIDIMLCQVDRSYLRLLQSYGRVVQQRNAVMARVGLRSQARLLELWDEKLVSEGSEIVRRRLAMMARLGGFASELYQELSDASELFTVAYSGSIGELVMGNGIEDAFRTRLLGEAKRSMEQRATLVGPHRDDLTFTIDGALLHAFGSRGQQRTAALALRMAEARYIESETGQQPILLLDEAIGELDEGRRNRLVAFVRSHAQVVLTGTSPKAYPDEFSHEAILLHVRSGTVDME